MAKRGREKKSEVQTESPDLPTVNKITPSPKTPNQTVVIETQGKETEPPRRGLTFTPVIEEEEEEIVEGGEEVPDLGEKPQPPKEKLWSEILTGNRVSTNGLSLKLIESDGDEICITREDVEPEIIYWKHSLSAYILGQDVPVSVMINFLRNRWKGLVQPQVVKHEKGFFVLRFESEEDMIAALQRGSVFFYSKPVIMRKWHEGMKMEEKPTHVPIWVQLTNLPLEYWGASSLSKLVSKIGEPLNTDEMTAKKLKLEYARILVRVEIGKELPKELVVKSYTGATFKQPVKYEWLPQMCQRCSSWGHQTGACQKKMTQVWVRKQDMKDKEPVKATQPEPEPKSKELQFGSVRMEGLKAMGQTEGSEWQRGKGLTYKSGGQGSTVKVQTALQNLFQVMGEASVMLEGESSQKPPDI